MPGIISQTTFNVIQISVVVLAISAVIGLIWYFAQRPTAENVAKIGKKAIIAAVISVIITQSLLFLFVGLMWVAYAFGLAVILAVAVVVAVFAVAISEIFTVDRSKIFYFFATFFAIVITAFSALIIATVLYAPI
ncbi:MAG: hypothetical protein FWG68_05860 [Defluviitaleaceae bacterium]|nr:hypothetical protein [Defluviitaleaceae bacterium]